MLRINLKEIIVVYVYKRSTSIDLSFITEKQQVLDLLILIQLNELKQIFHEVSKWHRRDR